MDVLNKKAYYDYEVIEKYEAGIVLTGTEIKSIRKGNAQIKDSYAYVRNSEIFLINMHISYYKEGNIFNHEETRMRKLLLHKKEIIKLKKELDTTGYTLIPLKLYITRGIAKIELGLCKGKKNYDKREVIKQRDIDRYMKKELKY